jgi:hypothetical protein
VKPIPKDESRLNTTIRQRISEFKIQGQEGIAITILQKMSEVNPK